MGNWLQRMAGLPQKTSGRRVQSRSSNGGAVQSAGSSKPPAREAKGELPNASIVYGIGSGLLFLDSFFLLVENRWFVGLVVFFLGGCLAAFAFHFLKYRD